MGSSGSKASHGTTSFSSSSSSSLSSGTERRGKSRAHRVFQSSCLGTSSRSLHTHSECDRDRDRDRHHQVCNNRKKENGGNGIASCCIRTTEMDDSDGMKAESFGKVKVDESDEMPPCLSSNLDLDQCRGQGRITDTVSRSISGTSSVRSSSTQSFNPSTRFLSRFSFIPGNVSFRLSRATSVGSSRSYPVSSSNLAILNDEDELRLQQQPRAPPANAFVHTRETQQGSDLLPATLVNGTSTQFYEDTTSNSMFNAPSSGFPDNLQHNETISHLHDVGGDSDNVRNGVGLNLYSPRIHNETGSNETRLFDRRIGAREPVERNFRFSRTLSVGRLRDRVHRRSSLSELTFCPLQQEREARDTGQDTGRQAWEGETRALASEGNAVTSPTTSGYPQSSMSSSLFSIQDYEAENSRIREGRYHDIQEHRSNFLERRRRIRSQVRALQRLGSRFENMSGHERSCILSGQHRTGRCTCRTSNRDANLNDDTGARASISRIVMLAEALFEVLDEIHQQSVVLSSRPSVSSIGSVPAPSEVVETLPVKLYVKLQKHQNEEAAQCYICLLEYEEGDSMRVLPCHHEFHRTCVDKWLKEIHRVCPLCRGDICRSDALPAEN